MADPRASRGKTVTDGVINYLSPSSMTTADPEQTGGCFRRWHFKYVAGRKEPTTAAMTAGTEIHAQLEHYLKTGEKTLGAQAMAGAQYVPRVDTGLLVEHAIGEGELTAAGIPVIGYIDLVKLGRDFVDEEGEPGRDPEGTVELLDWKTTSNLRNAKQGHELINTIQMPAYAEWAARKFDAAYFRISHVYFQTKGRPLSKKATRIYNREKIAERWERIEGVARSLVQIARVKPEHSNQVEANTAACPVWGGCPRRNDGSCKVGAAASLEQMFGKGASMSLLGRINPPAAPAAPVAAPAATLDLKAEMARLEAEQKAAAKPALPPGFEAACKAVEASGRGFPALTGPAALARAQMLGLELKSSAMAGSGGLGGLSLADPALMTQLADELAKSASVAPAPGILPPDAPESKPELAAVPIDVPAAPSVVVTATIEPMKAESLLNVATPEAPKKPRGRPRKADAPPVSQRNPLTGTVSIQPVTAVDASEPVQAEAASGINVFVDCIPSVPYALLDGYIDDACRVLAEFDNAVDIRCPSKDGRLDFGKWKGALAAYAREKPPGAGTYVILTRSEPAEVVADALRGLSDLYVRGVR